MSGIALGPLRQVFRVRLVRWVRWIRARLPVAAGVMAGLAFGSPSGGRPLASRPIWASSARTPQPRVEDRAHLAVPSPSGLARPGATLVILVDVSRSAGGSDPQARIRLAWLRFLTAIWPSKADVGVMAFAGRQSDGWLIPPTRARLAQETVDGWRLLPPVPALGGTDVPAAETWAIDRVPGPFDAVVLSDDEPDPGERRAAATTLHAVARDASRYRAGSDGLLTLRLGDNAGPLRFPVLGSAPMGRSADTVLAWAGALELSKGLRPVPSPLPAGGPQRELLIRAAPGGTVAVTAIPLGSRVSAGAVGWLAPTSAPVLVVRNRSGSLAVANLSGHPVRVALTGMRARTHWQMRLGPGAVEALPATLSAGVSGLAFSAQGAAPSFRPRVRPGQAGHPSGLAAAAGRPRTREIGRDGSAVGILLGLVGAVGLVQSARRRRRGTGGPVAGDVSSGPQEVSSAVGRAGTTSDAIEIGDLFRTDLFAIRKRGDRGLELVVTTEAGDRAKTGEDGSIREVRYRLGRGFRNGMMLGPGPLAGGRFRMVPTRAGRPLCRVFRGSGGVWTLEALSGFHLYGADGVPARSAVLASGVRVRVADVTISVESTGQAPAPDRWHSGPEGGRR